MNFEWSKKILRFQFIKKDSTVEIEWELNFPIFLDTSMNI